MSRLRRAAVGGLVAWALTLLLAPAPARAHAFAPSLLEVREVEEGTYAIRFKQPETQPTGARLRPVFPEDCQATSDLTVEEEGTGIVAGWQIACAGGLTGKTLSFEGIAASQADVLLRLELGGEGGTSIRHVLTADAPSFEIPAEESFWGVVGSYGRIGFQHILEGLDHLLFVFGLLLLVEGRGRLVATVTAFTVGHSITLGLAVLGFVHLPSRPVEALIAASILVLAVELTRRRGGIPEEETLMRRRPWLVAGGFGLLHGLGFAGALSEVGLPQGEIPAALLAFNVGIELGQLAFIAVVLAIGALLTVGLRTLRLQPPQRWALAPAYLIGVLSAFWVFERVLG